MISFIESLVTKRTIKKIIVLTKNHNIEKIGLGAEVVEGFGGVAGGTIEGVEVVEDINYYYLLYME